MNSPIRKNNGEDEGLNLPKALKFAANSAFGTEQAKPVNNAETAAFSPPKGQKLQQLQMWLRSVVKRFCSYF